MNFPRIHDPELTLLTPDDDVANPEVTILVPSLNEELTIGTFVDWCREGIAASGAAVEILIVDSSTDRTPEIARARGARVLQTPKRGLGKAYIDAIPFVRASSSSWAMRTAPMIFARSRRLSRPSGRVTTS